MACDFPSASFIVWMGGSKDPEKGKSFGITNKLYILCPHVCMYLFVGMGNYEAHSIER